jgi:hypothetical protein
MRVAVVCLFQTILSDIFHFGHCKSRCYELVWGIRFISINKPLIYLSDDPSAKLSHNVREG